MNTISARAGVIGVIPLRPPSLQARLKRQQMNHIKRSRERGTITRKQFVQQMAWKNLAAARILQLVSLWIAQQMILQLVSLWIAQQMILQLVSLWIDNRGFCSCDKENGPSPERGGL
ncbi:hypothetical protein ACOMHN_039739 [Nucella lapillus]